jgi:hypothetical protein
MLLPGARALGMRDSSRGSQVLSGVGRRPGSMTQWMQLARWVCRRGSRGMMTHTLVAFCLFL